MLTNEPLNKSIGEELVAARIALGLSVDMVADALLLSKRQILAIESGEMRVSFYTEAIYWQCVDKYASYLGLLTKPSVRVPPSVPSVPSDSLGELSEDCDALDLPRVYHRLNRAWWAIVAFAILILVVQSVIPTTNADSPKKQPLGADRDVKLPNSSNFGLVAAEPQSNPVKQVGSFVSSVLHSSIRIQVTGPCWLQWVDSNGAKFSKLYQQGDEVELQLDSLSSITIGNRNMATAYTSQGKAIDFSSFEKKSGNAVLVSGTELRGLAE